MRKTTDTTLSAEVPAPTDTAPWRIVAAREIAVKLRDRNFIISTVTTLAIFAISIGVSFLLSGREDTTTIGVATPEAAVVVDDARAASGASDSAVPEVDLETRQYGDPDAIEEAVRSEEVDLGLVDNGGQWTLVSTDGADGSVAAAIGATVSAEALSANAEAAGISLESLYEGTTVQERMLDDSGADKAITFIAALVFGMLFYMAAILFGYAIANSVVEEKQSRIVEILAAAIPLRQLLVGKVIGATTLAVGQMVLFVGVGLVGITFTDYADLLPQVAGAGLWYLAFFVVGFVALACLFAVAGAMSTRAEDVQTTSSPLLMIIMVAAFGGMFLQGLWQTVGSYVPIMSVVAMPSRLAEGSAQWWEPVLSLLITAVFAAVTIMVAERVYRRSLMQTGGKLTYRQALTLKD